MAEKVKPAIVETALTGAPYENEVVLRGNAGIRHAFRMRGFAIPERCCVIAFEEITEQRRAEESLARSEAQFRGLVEDLNDVVFAADAQAASPTSARRNADPRILVGRDDRPPYLELRPRQGHCRPWASWSRCSRPRRRPLPSTTRFVHATGERSGARRLTSSATIASSRRDSGRVQRRDGRTARSGGPRQNAPRHGARPQRDERYLCVLRVDLTLRWVMMAAAAIDVPGDVGSHAATCGRARGRAATNARLCASRGGQPKCAS
jgi:PAS domain-containing protein